MSYPELDVFRSFRQVIVWGFPLHTHTHSYIHGAWVKTFKSIGIPVHWFHDKEFPVDFDYTNSCFITEGWADDNIPINDSSTYFVHIAKDPARYLSKGARLIEIRYNVKEIHDFNYDYVLPKEAVNLSRDTLYEVVPDDSAVASKRGRPVNKTPYEAVYMYWATDLLPGEFQYSDAALVRNKVVGYIGTISHDHPFHAFKRAAESAGVRVQHVDPWRQPVSFEENIRIMKESYCAPDFRSRGDPAQLQRYGPMNGTNHLDIGYIPCRVFKAISYGQTGITNSKRVKELLGDYVEYTSDPSEVIQIVGRRENDIAWRKECMKYVAENHTFLQRARDLARALRMKSSNVTCVTALYDIGRERVDGRSIPEYMRWLSITLRTIRDPFVLFLDKSLNLKKKVLDARTSAGPIQIYETALSETPMWKYREKIADIQKNKAGLKYPNDITNTLPEYCVIQYGKFGWLESSIKKNTFNSPMFGWIDAGFSRFYDSSKNYSFIPRVEDKFFIQADATKRLIPSLTPDAYICTNERILAGWMWIMGPFALSSVKTEVMRIWDQEMMAKSRMDNEQIALALASQSVHSMEFVDTAPGIPGSIFTKFFGTV